MEQEFFGSAGHSDALERVVIGLESDRFYNIVIRILNVTIATVLIILTLPIVVVIGIAICLDSPGPPLFRQQRLGLGAKPFWFHKFRTMYVDARQRFPDLYCYQYTPDELAVLRFKMPKDPRLTGIGSWLRKTSLDELPNFLNVLRGDMNLVGPRPEIPELLRYYRRDQLVKWSVRPGVTGLAQVYGRAFLRFQETIAYDLEYVRRRSLTLDLKILVLTVWKVLRGVGAF